MKKTKPDDRDDGVSYTDMNVPGMPWYTGAEANKNRAGLKGERLTGKERRAIARAVILKMLPIFLSVVLSFTLIAILMWLWIS